MFLLFVVGKNRLEALPGFCFCSHKYGMQDFCRVRYSVTMKDYCMQYCNGVNMLCDSLSLFELLGLLVGMSFVMFFMIRKLLKSLDVVF